MSTREQASTTGRTRPPRYRLLQWPALLWLTLVWLALWRSFTPANALLGLAVAVAVSLVFPLPPLRMSVRPRPIALAWLLLRFAWDVVVSSVEVTLVVLRPRGLTNALVQVDLVTPSDFVLTIVGEMTTLIPGSVVVEARRSTHTLFFHVINVKGAEDVERFRRTVLAQEQRVLRAFGQPLPGTATREVVG